MNGIELNKIAAAILLAGLIAMVIATVTDSLYLPHHQVEKRGYSVAVNEKPAGASAAAAEEVFKIGQLMAKADPTLGAQQFKKCAMCHTADKGGHNRVGPNLWGVVGAAKLRHKEFNYSPAMVAVGGKWEYSDLFHFLRSPRKFINGTRMGFAGFSKAEDIANVLAYLRTLTDVPDPLPEIEK